MKWNGWWRCALLICLGAVACRRSRTIYPPHAFPSRDDGVIDLTLMSFNVRYENSEDRDERAWRQRILRSFSMIRREQPDVLGVQEALRGQVADLWASLPEYQFFGIGRDDGKAAGEYAGLFYRRDRFRADPTDQGTFWLSDFPEKPGSKTWGNEYPRVTTWLHLRDLATGRWFYVFNTHWDHRNQASRERAARLIALRIDRRQHPADPVVLLGDFNSVETNPGLRYLTGKPAQLAGERMQWPGGLVDTFRSLHASEKNSQTLHLWRNTREGTLKVDHILVSKEAKVMSAEIISADQPAISDHFPVRSTVLFPLP